MRVTQITERYPPAKGGVETHVSRLSRELVKIGVSVTVITTDLLGTNPMTRMAVRQNPSDEDGVRVRRLRAFEALPLRQGLGVVSPQVAFYLKNADLIHAHGYGRYPTFVAGLRRVLHTPVVITTHSDRGRPSLRKSFFDAAISPLTIRSADAVIAISEHEKEVLERLGVNPSSIVVVPNGVDPGEFSRPGGRPKRGHATILYVGRIDFEQKGVDVLLQSVSLMTDSLRTRVRLKLVGPDWGDLERTYAMARELGIADSVEYLGVLPHEGLVDAMSSADVLALPSRFEPFGIVLLEAMAAGLPVVASNVGGVPEIVREFENGLLSEPGDPRSLSLQLSRILTDPELGMKLAESARRSLTSYSWPSVAKRILALYEEVVRKSAAQRRTD